MKTAVRRGRASFLSQIPEILPSVSKVDPLTDFFTLVQRTYERAQEAMETAKTGYNIDVAKATLSGGGGAYETRDQAWDALKRAKADGLITEEQASDLARDVMGPLEDAVSQAKVAIIENEGRGITYYWNSFSDSVAKLVSNSTGFVTKSWHDVLKGYRLMDEYLATANAYIAQMEPDAQSEDAKAYLASYKAAVGTIAAQKTHIETVCQSVGIPTSALKEQAAKEDVASLGAGPGAILGYSVFGLVTVATILKVLAPLVSIWTLFSFGVLDAVLSLVGLESVVVWRIKRNMIAEEKAKTEVEKEKLANETKELLKKDETTKSEINKTFKTSDAMAKVTGMQEQADKLRAKAAARRAELGVDTPVTQQTWFPWVLAIGSGLTIAAIIYWYTHRNSE